MVRRTITSNLSYRSTLVHKTPNKYWTKDQNQEWLTNQSMFKAELCYMKSNGN